MNPSSRNLTVLSIILFIAMLPFSGINLVDGDMIVESEVGYSIHKLAIALFGGNPVIGLLMNILLFAVGMYIIIPFLKNYFALILIINPFSLMNILDAYNRFALVFFVFSLMLKVTPDFKKWILMMIALGMHPIYFGVIHMMIKVEPLKLLIVSMGVISIFLLGYDIYVLDAISPDKVDLYANNKFDLASMAGGNYKLNINNYDFPVIKFLESILSILFFPFYIEKDFEIIDFILYIVMACGSLGLIFNQFQVCKNLRCVAIFIISTLLFVGVVSVTVGNLAVFYRHFLPTIPLLLYFQYYNFARID